MVSTGGHIAVQRTAARSQTRSYGTAAFKSKMSPTSIESTPFETPEPPSLGCRRSSGLAAANCSTALGTNSTPVTRSIPGWRARNARSTVLPHKGTRTLFAPARNDAPCCCLTSEHTREEKRRRAQAKRGESPPRGSAWLQSPTCLPRMSALEVPHWKRVNSENRTRQKAYSEEQPRRQRHKTRGATRRKPAETPPVVPLAHVEADILAVWRLSFLEVGGSSQEYSTRNDNGTRQAQRRRARTCW